MPLDIISKSSKETQKAGKLLAADLCGREIFGLIGELGSGKTTFVQGVAKGLKIQEKIKSPTFVILKKYTVPKHKTIKYFYHLDLYRLSNFSPIGKNIDNLGFDLKEILQKDSVVFIEWAEKIAPLLPSGWIKVEFKYVGEKTRAIIINES